MKEDIIKLYKETISLNIILDKLVEEEKNEEYEKILELKSGKDGILYKYLKVKKEYENERRMLMNKYEKELSLPFKDDIIYEIKKEVRLKTPSITPEELQIFSTNVFIIAALLAQNIKDQEAIEKMMKQNLVYYEEKQETTDYEKYTRIDYDLEYLTYLKEKYTNLIKEKLEVSAI